MLILGFESADHSLDAWAARALECCRDHGGAVPEGAGKTRADDGAAREGAAGAWRNAFLRAPYLRDTLVATFAALPVGLLLVRRLQKSPSLAERADRILSTIGHGTEALTAHAAPTAIGRGVVEEVLRWAERLRKLRVSPP